MIGKIFFKVSQKKYGVFLIVAILCCVLSGCDLRCGLAEAIFQLAPESRLPSWFDLSGYRRKDLTMTITFCVVPFGPKAKIVVYGPLPERKELFEITGKMRHHPLSGKGASFPNYTIITVDDIDEIFEQRKAEDILYITDDPKVTDGYRKRKQ